MELEIFRQLTNKQKASYYKEMLPILVFNNMQLEYVNTGDEKLKELQKLWRKVETKYINLAKKNSERTKTK